MGIVNATPDSFSGDGLVAGGSIGSRSPPRSSWPPGWRPRVPTCSTSAVSRPGPGHAAVDEAEELRRVVPIVAALHAAQPDLPISVDTTKPAVAAAALDAGAALINHVWGVADDDALARLAAERDVPIVLMHNRLEPHYEDLMTEIVADLERAIERALRAGCRWETLIVDPGFGFGKTADHNLVLLRELDRLRVLGRPILLGTSRKSTLGRVLDLPPEERLEATLVTTALGIAAGVDIVRVHDVAANVRAARMADAIVRGGVVS